MSHRPILVTTRVQLSRSALAAYVSRTAERLHRNGFRAGQRAAVCIDNSAESVVVLLAFARLDAVVIPVDARQFLSAGQLETVAHPDVLVLPRPTTKSSSRTQQWSSDAQCTVWRAEQLLILPPGAVDEEDTAAGSLAIPTWPWAARPNGLVQLTSGTSDLSAEEKQPAHFLANCERTAEFIGYVDDDVLAPILPISHQYGLSLLFIALLRDIPVVLSQPDRVLEALRLGIRHGASVVDTTPQVHQAILRWLDIGRIAGDAVAGVRLWCVGGGPVSTSLQKQARTRRGHGLLDGYGSTELGNIAHAVPGDDASMRPLPGIEMRVSDAQDEPLPAGSWGRLWVRTPDCSRPDTWHDTADLAQVDERGCLIVAGRFDALDRNGLLVFPAVIERQLQAEGINVCALAVRKTPDESVRRTRFGSDRLVLVVEDRFRRRPGWWQARIGSLLPLAWRPDRVVSVAALPRTASTAKVDRSRVERYARAVERVRDHEELSDLTRRRQRRDCGAQARRAGEGIDRVVQLLRSEREGVLEVLRETSCVGAAEVELEATLQALRGARGEMAFFDPPKAPQSWVYMPSNVLLYSYALYLLVPSVFTDTIWFRPSSRTAPTLRRLHEILAPEHGLDVRLFSGTQAEFVSLRADQPGTVVFTGRHANAEQVRADLRPRQLMVFFGQGSNPIVVGARADLDKAVHDTAAMRMLNSGQDCFGPDLVLVHQGVADQFVSRLTQEIGRFSLEHLSPTNDYLSSDDETISGVVEHLTTHRDRIAWGGRMDLRQAMVEPTVLQWDVAAAPECAEVFSPVFNVVRYRDEADVRELLDRPFYRDRSMCASVYGVSPQLQAWLAERTTVSVDCSMIASDDPNQPLGGIGVMSNYVATTAGLSVGPVLISHAVATHAPALGWTAGAPAATSVAV